MSRDLNALSYRLRAAVFEFIARLTEAGIHVLIVTTGRTDEEQEELFAQGRTKPGKIVTWTRRSKHQPQPPDMKSLAIDVCPFDIYELHGPDKLQWNTEDPVWQKIGAIGESLGLKWGVMLPDGNSRILKRGDLGHFEYKAVQPSGTPKKDDYIV